MQLSDILGQVLGGNTVRDLSGQLGTDEKTTGSALSAALPVLIGALSRNASKDNGAEELHGALTRDHDGSILDDLGSLLGKAKAGQGDGILRHVLGSRRPNVESNLSKSSGLDAGSVSRMLTMVAPILMGALGKMQRSQNMDASSLRNNLNREASEVEKKSPSAMGALSQLLDTDHDGDVDIADIAKHGFKLFGKFFSR